MQIATGREQTPSFAFLKLSGIVFFLITVFSIHAWFSMDADPKDTEGQLYQAEGYLISRQLYQAEISRFMLTTCNRQYGIGKRTDT